MMIADRRVWLTALLCFLLAASAGAFLRFGYWQGLPWGLVTTDVRHAHSHLMFFGWVTPVLMLFLLRQQGGRLPRWLFGFTFLAALSSFVPFLLSGYGMMQVAGRLLPVSMITSGISGIAWYWFAAVYVSRARKLPTSPAGLAATVLMLISTAGVFALAFAGMRHLGPVPIAAAASFFLDLFGEGWFGLGLLAIAYGIFPAVRHSGTGLLLLASGLVVRCAADWAVALGSTGLAPVSHAASLAAGVGMLMLVWPLLRGVRPGLWHVPLILLAIKAGVDVLSAVPAFQAWSDAAGLRVFYLHAFLLGAISTGLIAAARSTLGPGAFPRPWLFVAAALVMTGALLPLTGAWPAALAGAWALPLAAWTSLLPLAAVLAQAGRN